MKNTKMFIEIPNIDAQKSYNNSIIEIKSAFDK